jgi:hypothetical protein
VWWHPLHRIERRAFKMEKSIGLTAALDAEAVPLSASAAA